VTGELYLGGDGLARGYFNRPDLTAERFLPNPFGSAGTRLYQTGDRVRWLPDGEIEFLGRLDYQVKLRGFRIELGEIETILGQHSSVRESLVLAREDRPGNKRLVAYLLPENDIDPDAQELRAFLRQKLPEYMVPSAYVTLEAFPLTANGKIDRRALPAPDASARQIGSDFIGPRTPGEEILAEIWAEILGIEQVGVQDNFFDLGGNSLLAVKMISRLCQALDIELSLGKVFAQPTIEGLAQLIAAVQYVQGDGSMDASIDDQEEILL
jgi:acyl carrier protein